MYRCRLRLWYRDKRQVLLRWPSKDLRLGFTLALMVPLARPVLAMVLLPQWALQLDSTTHHPEALERVRRLRHQGLVLRNWLRLQE